MAILKKTVFLAFVGMLLVGDASALSEGTSVPRVDLVPLAGKTVDLAKLKGRVVILDFWATWCAPCLGQLEFLDEVARRFSAEGLVVVTASIDDAGGTATEFLKQRFPRPSFRVAHDPGGKALAAFGADGIPALYVIDPRGRVRYRHFGSGGEAELREVLRGLLSSPEPALPPLWSAT